MKRIEAIIRPARVPEVCDALAETGHPGVTVSLVEGRENEQSWMHHVRGGAYQESLRSRARVEVVVADQDAGVIVHAIRNAAFTGEAGDGKIFIHEMADAIRIRTNETGQAALK